MKWILSARGFGTNGAFVELEVVEADTERGARAILREGPHASVFFFHSRDVRVSPVIASSVQRDMETASLEELEAASDILDRAEKDWQERLADEASDSDPPEAGV
jgi:hypothetical protein